MGRLKRGCEKLYLKETFIFRKLNWQSVSLFSNETRSAARFMPCSSSYEKLKTNSSFNGLFLCANDYLFFFIWSLADFQIK